MFSNSILSNPIFSGFLFSEPVCIFLIALLLLLFLPVLCAALLVLSALITAEYRMYKKPLRRIYEERSKQKDFCALNRMPKRFLEMVVQGEDSTFFRHKGIRMDAIKRALKTNLKAHCFLVGGSSITQQLVKNLYCRFDRKLFRKFMDIFMALKAEKILSKSEILELYINIIYYGCGNYGITDAVKYYFSETPEEMTTNQMFLLSGIICNPTTRNPITDPEFYIQKQREFMELQLRRQRLTEEEARIIDENLNGELDPKLRKTELESKYWKYGKNVEINERFGIETDLGSRAK